MDLLNLNSRMLLDKRDKNGRVVLVAKLGKSFFLLWNWLFFWSNFQFNFLSLLFLRNILGNVASNTQFCDASLIDDIWMQVLLNDPLTQINGITVIADCTGLTSAILKWLIPKNCRVGATKLESLPLKKWTIHVVNMGAIFKTCIMFIKPFLRKATLANVRNSCTYFANDFLTVFTIIFSFSLNFTTMDMRI